MAIIDDITSLYIGYFNRAPDPAGLNFWVSQAVAGASLAGIANSFSKVPEATNLYGFLSAPLIGDKGVFLASVYQNLFGRTVSPTAPELDYWKAQLSNPAITVGRIIVDIISGAQGDDKLVITNKTTVGVHFVQEMTNKNLAYNSAADQAAHSAFTGVTTDPASVTAANTAVDTALATSVAGAVSSQTLTVNQDVVSGAVFDAPIFTSTFTGAQIQTLTSVDRLTGGSAVTDALNAVLNATEVNTKPTLAAIENVRLTAIANSVFDAANSTGVNKIGSVDSSANLTVRNLATAAAVEVKNTAAAAHSQFQFANSVVSGTSDAVTVNMDSVGRGAVAGNTQILNIRGETSGGFETFNIVTAGGASRFADIGSDATVGIGVAPTNAGSSLKTVNVAGTANLRVDNPLLNVTTVDANTFEGNLRVSLDITKNVAVTGGKGADFFNFAGGLSNLDTVKGGDGRDTIAVTSNAGLGDGNAVTGVETLRNNGAAAGTIFDLSKVSSFDSVVHNTANTAIYNNLTKAGAADATMGVNQLGTGAITIGVKDANALGSNNDVLQIKVGSLNPADNPATFVAGAVTTAAIEKIVVNVADAGANTATAAGAFLAADAALGTVQYTGGSLGIAFNAGAPAGSGVGLTNVDGSGFIGNLTASGNAFSQLIKGGTGNDVLLTGGRAAFVLGTVSDTLTGGSGGDTFTFQGDAAAGSDALLTGANLTAIDAALAVAATNRGEITTITDLNLGGASAGTRVDTIDFAGAAALLNAVAAGAFNIVNGGAATALTGVDLGAAVNTAINTGILDGVNRAGLFTWSGDTYLIATTGATAANNFGAVAGEDIIIKVTGVTGSLDASDFV